MTITTLHSNVRVTLTKEIHDNQENGAYFLNIAHESTQEYQLHKRITKEDYECLHRLQTLVEGFHEEYRAFEKRVLGKNRNKIAE